MKLLVAMVCFMVPSLNATAEQRLFADPLLKIDGAKVASSVDAKRIASTHYYEKTKSLDAHERIGKIAIIDLDYDVPGFAVKGDRIWQAYVLRSAPRPNMLRGIIWIHPETGQVHFVTGVWGSAEAVCPPFQIEGAKVSHEADAKRIAFEHYIKKMKTRVLAEEGVQKISVFKLGYDVPGFAAKGDIIWQASVKTLALGLESKLRGIIWVHSKTEKVHFVTGAWENLEQE